MGMFGFRKSIRKEMLAYFIIGSLLPITVVLLVLSGFHQKNIHKELVEDAQLSLRVLNTELQFMIDRLEAAVIAGSRDRITVELLSAGEDAYDSLREYAAHLRETTASENISFYDTKGRSILSSDMDRRGERLDDDLIDRIESKKTGETPALVDMSMDIEKGIRVDVYAPVIEPFYAYLQGIIREDILIDKRFLTELKERTGAEFALFYQEKAVFSTFASVPEIGPSDYNKAIGTKRTVSLDIQKIHGAEYHTLLDPVIGGDDVPGVIGVFISEESMKRSIDFSRWMFFAIFLVVIVFSFAISRFSTSKIVTPILSTVRALRRISRGELKYRVDIKSQNEIGEMGNSFNRMAEDLERSTVSKDYVENIMRSMIDSLIVINPNETVKTVNKATCGLLGYKEEELTGKDVSSLFLKDEDEERSFKGTELKKLIEEGSMSNYEVNFKTRDGNKIPMLLSGSVMRDKKGNITDIVCVAKDITERKKAEEQIKTSLQEKEILIGEVYHRTRNNMSVICSLLSMQSACIKDGKVLTVLKEMDNRIKSMSLVHSKLYQAKDLSSINLKDYIADLVSNLSRSYLVTPDKISLKFIADDVPLAIDYAIPCGLAINEIITNSLKYAFPESRKGEIKITLRLIADCGLRNTDSKSLPDKRQAGEMIELKIADNGIGMPKGFDIRNTDTLGSRLVFGLIEQQLGGKIELNCENGVEYQITFKGLGYTKRV